MFIKKTSAQLESMSDAERDDYAAQKEANDNEQMQKEVDSKVTAKVEEIKTGLEKDFVPKSELEAATLVVTELKATVEKQGEKIVAMGKSGTEHKRSVRELIGKQITEAIGDIFTNVDTTKGETYSQHFSKSFIVKDALPADPSLHSTENIPTGVISGGITAAVDASWLLLNSGQRSSKVFGAPILRNNILNFIPIKRLVGKILYGSTLAVPTGAATYTPECALKPQVKQTIRIAKAEAGKIAEVIRMSEEYMMYVWEVVDNEIMPRYEQMLTNALATAVFDGAAGTPGINGIVDNASTYVLVPQHQIFTDPNLLDVIAVASNYQMIKEWNVDIIALNPANQVELTNSKASDGHYDVFNNGSIQLVDGQQVYVNGGVTPIIYTNSVAAGKIFVASFDAFEVGISDQLMMKISNSARDGDFEHNIWTIILEKFTAVLSPTESSGGILYDDIDNIKTLITIEQS